MTLLKNNQIVLFDGLCILCSNSVKFIIRHDPMAIFKFAPFQSKYGETICIKHNLSTNMPESIILIDKGQIYDKSTAALKVAKKLNGLWPVFYVFIIIPKPIRDFFYDLIARHRYKLFGNKDTCMIPDKRYLQRFIE